MSVLLMCLSICSLNYVKQSFAGFLMGYNWRGITSPQLTQHRQINSFKTLTMEPVILFIAITAIISGTYIRAKKINLEKERMRLGANLPPEPPKKGLFSRAKNAVPPLTIRNTKSNEADQLHRRLENLEVILLDQADSQMPSNDQAEILQEIRNLSTRIKKLEGN